MNISAYGKDIFRTIKLHFTRFLAIAIMAALGIGMFSGFAVGCLNVFSSADIFYDEHKTYDIQIVSTLGLTDEDREIVENLEDIDEVAGIYTVEADAVMADGTVYNATVQTMPENGMNMPYIIEGTLPENKGEMIVTADFLSTSDLKIGDKVKVLKVEDEDETDSDKDEAEDDEEKETELAATEFTITGSVITMLDFSQDSLTGAALTDDADGSAFDFFVTEESVSGDVYSMFYATVVGAAEMDCFSDEYKDFIKAKVDYIENNLKEEREEARYNDIVSRAQSKIDDGWDELKDEMADAEKEFADAQTEIDDGWEEINDGEKKLNKGQRELNNAVAELQSGQEEINNGWAEIYANEETLNTQKAEAYAQLDEGEAQLTEALAQAEAGLGYGQDEMILPTIENIKAQMEGLALNRAEADAQFAEAEAQIAAAKAELEAGQEKINSGAVEVAANQRKINNSRKDIEEGKQELIDGQEELDENYAEYQEEIKDAQDELKDAQEEVDDIEMATWYAWSRLDNDCFSGLKTNTNFIKTITRFFPVLFFCVAILISLSTMTRMVEEDRGLIGTYKSLGYSNVRISMKYIWYALIACGVGSILGTLIGGRLLPLVIRIIMLTLYFIPDMDYFFYPTYEVGGIVICILGIVGATWFSCNDMVHKKPAVLMRPKAPKPGKRILLERIPFIWSRMKFLNKITCRNIFRYKKRAFMTIIGIMGCTMLIVLGYGISDTVGGIMDSQYGKLVFYDEIVVTSSMTDDERQDLETQWIEGVKGDTEVEPITDMMSVQISSMTLRANSESNEVSVFVLPDNADNDKYFAFYDYYTKEKKQLSQETVILTESVGRLLELSTGDDIILQNDKNIEGEFTIDFVCQNHVGNYVYMTKSCYDSIFEDFEENAYLANLPGNVDEKTVWEEHWKDDDRVSAVSSTHVAIESFSDTTKLVSMVVYLLIGMSAALALTVLFTLSNINISERIRELATIKVLGFTRKEVNAYVNKETIFLTVIGILVGLPVGYILTYFILDSVNMMGVTMSVYVSAKAYIIAAVFTFAFAIFVERLTNKDLVKINMVEALKSVE